MAQNLPDSSPNQNTKFNEDAIFFEVLQEHQPTENEHNYQTMIYEIHDAINDEYYNNDSINLVSVDNEYKEDRWFFKENTCVIGDVVYLEDPTVSNEQHLSANKYAR